MAKSKGWEAKRAMEREEDEEGGYDIGSRLLALSLQIRAVGQDTV